MSTAANPSAVFSPALAIDKPRSAPVPWYLWTGVLAVTSSFVGGAWDVSWHRSVGRDTFWTPAHMLIYACGLLAGVIGLWFVAKCTFGHDPAFRARSVQIFGLRAPLGVFLAGWGGIAMMTSAPFDNWWHNAYGLDVKIVSPPHVLLILGLRGVAFGILFLILAEMNRALIEPSSAAGGPLATTWPPAPQAVSSNLPFSHDLKLPRQLAPAETPTFLRLRTLFLYLGGLTVGGQMFFLQEYTWDILLHQAAAYVALGVAVPVVFATFSQASRFRWAATTTAAVYTLFTIGEILILPLVPAQPKLGPVYHAITHLVPTKFPILILVPAIALDLLWRHAQTRPRNWPLWRLALASGILFIAVLTAVEWPFANFLLSHASENRFFGTIYFGYNSAPGNYDLMRRFFHPDHGLTLAYGLARAALYASISTWIGFRFGRWMRTVQR